MLFKRKPGNKVVPGELIRGEFVMKTMERGMVEQWDRGAAQSREAGSEMEVKIVFQDDTEALMEDGFAIINPMQRYDN